MSFGNMLRKLLLFNNNLLVSSSKKHLSSMAFETLKCERPAPFVVHVQLNRSQKLNAMNDKMWCEIGECFEKLHTDKDCRSIVLSAVGKVFSSGMDFVEFAGMGPRIEAEPDIARKSQFVYEMIRKYQRMLSAIEKCAKPVICAIHGPCIGGALDLICATDIRVCSNGAWFQAKEVQIGMAPDVGTLQRLPAIIGSQSLVRELCLTGRKLTAREAFECGLVSHLFDNDELLLKEAIAMATKISKLSPVAVQLTKRTLNYSRDHSVDDSLDYIAIWNQTMLQSEDFIKAVTGELTKDDNVEFAKL